MSYVISKGMEISFAPETVSEEVVQNVRTIIATRTGTVPLFRDFGTAWEGLDMPVNTAKAMIRAEIVEAVERFEPRAVVDSVEWDELISDSSDGLMHPVVTVSLAEGVEDTKTTAH